MASAVSSQQTGSGMTSPGMGLCVIGCSRGRAGLGMKPARNVQWHYHSGPLSEMDPSSQPRVPIVVRLSMILMSFSALLVM
jgi:hypothetical protein